MYQAGAVKIAFAPRPRPRGSSPPTSRAPTGPTPELDPGRTRGGDRGHRGPSMTSLGDTGPRRRAFCPAPSCVAPAPPAAAESLNELARARPASSRTADLDGRPGAGQLQAGRRPRPRAPSLPGNCAQTTRIALKGGHGRPRTPLSARTAHRGGYGHRAGLQWGSSRSCSSAAAAGLGLDRRAGRCRRGLRIRVEVLGEILRKGWARPPAGVAGRRAEGRPSPWQGRQCGSARLRRSARPVGSADAEARCRPGFCPGLGWQVLELGGARSSSSSGRSVSLGPAAVRSSPAGVGRGRWAQLGPESNGAPGTRDALVVHL